LVLLLFPVATALRPAVKYLDSILLWVAYVIASFLILLALSFFPKSVDSITHRGFVFTIAGIFALISSALYPSADSLKSVMMGQDQDDCTILVAKQILLLDFPYDQVSYFGNPCSPLPGAIIPYLPFVALDAFLLANSFFLISLVLFLHGRLAKDEFRVGALTVLILLAIPQTLELMVNGSDFIFIGFAILVLVVSLEYPPRNEKAYFFMSLLAGLLASSRISLVVIAAAYLIALHFKSKQSFFTNFFVNATVGIAPSLIIFLINPEEFSPLHLVGKGASLLPGNLLLAMIFVTCALTIFAFINSKVRNSSSAIFILVLSPQLVFLSLGDLIFWRLGDFSTWEGASYWSILIPLLAYEFSKHFFKAR
jgi:hypothetical protein